MSTVPSQKAEASKAKKSSALRSFRLQLAVAVICFVTLSGCLAFFLLTYPEESPQAKLGLKTGEFLIQMILLVVAGGVFVQSYNRGQSKKAAINDFRKATLHSLIKAYSDTKKTRRILRAKVGSCQDEGSESAEAIPCTVYEEHMGTLNDTQLSLEVIRRELKVFESAFDDSASLVDCVTNMENYLSEIIDEYEKTLRHFHREPWIPLSRLPRLSAFMLRKQDSSDFGAFSAAFHKSLELIQLERVKVA